MGFLLKKIIYIFVKILKNSINDFEYKFIRYRVFILYN
jgi:hypothetical protein